MDGFKRPNNKRIARPPQSPGASPRMQPATTPQSAAKPTVKPAATRMLTPRPGAQSRPIDTEKLPPIDIPEATPGSSPSTSAKRRLPRWLWIVSAVIVLAVIATAATSVYLLSAKDSAATKPVSVEIVSGMLPGQIADKLEDAGVIRSSLAFRVYARLTGTQNSLQAGNYELTPADTTPAIVKQLQKGPAADEIEVTFTPGETLAESKDVLADLGYSKSEIDAAFSARYDHPLFQSRPATSDLEGYIFGETHRFVKGTPVKDILERYFDDYYAVIEKNDLVRGYKKQDLSLYEGITLASIIQREVRSEADQKQVAQVFYDRLSIGMPLGADATFEYIAKKEGIPPSPSIDSPYNTRKYAGLPPGPIAAPGVSALIAAAHPASGDYLYFVSGDDGVNHFSRTLEEHEVKVRQYCTTLCFGQ